MAESPTSSKVFISYSHRDKDYLDRLQAHLKPHVRAGTIPLWVDTDLKPGDDWEEEIKRALGAAQVAILLVSVSFLASDFVAEEELPRLLAAAEERGARILPIILTPCGFHRTRLSRFQAVNDPSKPLSGLSQHEQDVIWEQVVDAVLKALGTPIKNYKQAQPMPVSMPLYQEPIVQRAAPAQPSTYPTAHPPLGTLLAAYQGHTGPIWSIAWAPDGLRLASAGADKTVRIWDAVNGRLLHTSEGHTSTVHCVAWSPNGFYLASASEDKTVRLWDPSSGGLLRTCEGHTLFVNSVAWSPDSLHLASAGDNTIRVWDAAKGKLLICGDPMNIIWDVAWSPDGTRLASVGTDNMLRLWSTAKGRLLYTCEGHTDWIRSVVWSPNGTCLASASNDQTVRLWDANRGRLLHIYTNHTGWVHRVAWSPDGSRLASASSDWTIRLWDATSGQNLFTRQGYSNCVAWSPDGSCITSAGADNTVQIWSAG